MPWEFSPGVLDQMIAEHTAQRQSDAAERATRLQEEEAQRMSALNNVKESMIAQVIQQQMGGFQRGGQPVDVGGASTGGAPMQPTAVGPGGPQPFAQSGAQYQPPQQAGGVGGELVRKQMGLTGVDPAQKFQQQIMLEGIKSVLAGQRQAAGIEQREGLIRERLKDKMHQATQAQVMGSILQFKLDHGGVLPPEMQATWDMVHPIDKNVLDLAEKRLKDNPLDIGSSPQIQEKMRAEEINKIYTSFGRPGQHEEVPEVEEEEIPPDQLGLWDQLRNIFSGTTFTKSGEKK